MGGFSLMSNEQRQAASQSEDILVREATAPPEPDSSFEAALLKTHAQNQLEYSLASAAERVRKEITRIADDHLNRLHRQAPDVRWTVNVTWARERFMEYFTGRATFHDSSEFK
jgi:hypothetical protein